MPADARDPLSRQNPAASGGNPAIRNPYGGLLQIPTGSTNAYGLSNMDYSGQAAQAIGRARDTLRDVEQKKNTRYPTGSLIPGMSGFGDMRSTLPDRSPDETLGNNNTGGGAEDLGRADRQNAGQPEVDGFGNPVPPPPTGNVSSMPSTTGQGMPQGGENGGPATLSGMNTGAPATGGDISYQQDPEMKAQFMEVIDLLKQQGMGDLQAQKAALDWYQKQHGQADEDRTRMMDWANSVLGTGSYAGKSFDPNNPAAFAGIAADVNGLGQDLEERKRMIDESSLDPATKMRLKAEAEGETYSKKAKTRQDQIGAARQYIAHDQDAARAVQQAPQTGGAGQAAGAANANLGMQLNADIAAGGQTLQRNQFNSELEYRKALDAYNQQRQASRDAVSDSQWDRDYQLRVDAAKRAAQGGKTNFLSTLGGLLGKLGGGGGGGGSTLGNMFSNSGSSTSASSSQLDPSKPGQQGDFLNEDGGYNPGNRNGDESYYNPSSPFSTPNGGTARPGDPWW